MGDPAGARQKCTANIGEIDGTLMLVEPFANHKVEDNLNPLGGISPRLMSSSYDQHSNAGCICSLYRYRLIFGSVYNLARRISVLEDTFSDISVPDLTGYLI